MLSRFRSRFVGKVSQVHFFWGAMDLACTRFSGRTAPRQAGLTFLQTTYDAGADLGGRDRACRRLETTPATLRDHH